LNRVGKGERIWSKFFVYVYENRMMTPVEIFGYIVGTDVNVTVKPPVKLIHANYANHLWRQKKRKFYWLHNSLLVKVLGLCQI
jgi:hypothetical protein